MGDRSKRVLKWVAAIGGSMVLAGWAVSALYPNDWRPVEATVQSSQIKSVRYGKLDWALAVDTTYDVSGRSYEATTEVFRDVDRPVVEAEAARWPEGRTLTLYFDANNPKSFSREADGGREATVVTAVLLTPLFVSLAVTIGFLVRRPRRPNSPANSTDV